MLTGYPFVGVSLITNESRLVTIFQVGGPYLVPIFEKLGPYLGPYEGLFL